MNVLNFALIALDVAVVEGQSVVDGFRTVYFSLLPVEFASGLLTAGIAYAYQGENLSAVALVAVIGLVFQYLLRTALNSMERKDQLEGRTRELASLQVGLLGTVLQTLLFATRSPRATRPWSPGMRERSGASWASATATRTSSIRPRYCTTSGSSSSRTRSCSPQRGSRRRTSRSCGGTRSRARASSRA